MRDYNIKILQDTLEHLERGYYSVDGTDVALKLSPWEMKQVHVCLPEEAEQIYEQHQAIKEATDSVICTNNKCKFSCENTDSFNLARKVIHENTGVYREDKIPRVLVLNLANSVHPGGGVRRGATAQEEDLCRKSSLLLSLESAEARPYYEYNMLLRTRLGSNGMILTPKVEIIKDEEGHLLKNSTIVSVLTCAAPMVVYGYERLTHEEYRDMLYHRIECMLHCAAEWGYPYLVLGAFGCGVFGNDARLVSDLFCEAIQNFRHNGCNADDTFRRIDFAVLDWSDNLYNYTQFSRNFAAEAETEDIDQEQNNTDAKDEISQTEETSDAEDDPNPMEEPSDTTDASSQIEETSDAEDASSQIEDISDVTDICQSEQNSEEPIHILEQEPDVDSVIESNINPVIEPMEDTSDIPENISEAVSALELPSEDTNDVSEGILDAVSVSGLLSELHDEEPEGPVVSEKTKNEDREDTENKEDKEGYNDVIYINNNQDKYRGCLIGGAIGDALGYPVEFMQERTIFSRYGKDGLQDYILDSKTGKALISDDTQMTLFTAAGLLAYEAAGTGTENQIPDFPVSRIRYAAYAYQDWLITQKDRFGSYENRNRKNPHRVSWLLDIPELYNRRAPGNTCLTALEWQQSRRDLPDDFIHTPQNNSKGCGGIMRVAPFGLMTTDTADLDHSDLVSAQIAAITHGHSLGYMPAAVFTHIITRLVHGDSSGHSMDLPAAIQDAKAAADRIFAGNEHLKELDDIIELAITCSQNEKSDLDNIHCIGEGWVAEETLGIALYCCLRYPDDFTKAVTAAVNHNGDSDSTGAVTGNIMGALLGYEAIDSKWKNNLELSDIILQIANDMVFCSKLSEDLSYVDADWKCKYIQKKRPEIKKEEPVFFWQIREKNEEFSNWYHAPFIIGDFQYHCVEQYFMSRKAVLFHDAVTNTKILRANTPKECKDLGKKVTPFDSALWNEEKVDIMYKGNYEKYQQHPELKQKLLDTGDRILAEASPYDGIWGIGLSASEASKVPSDQWPGKNLLGRTLMKLRDDFRKEQEEQGAPERQ